jgi:hypothetical protein
LVSGRTGKHSSPVCLTGCNGESAPEAGRRLAFIRLLLPTVSGVLFFEKEKEYGHEDKILERGD